MRPGRRRRLLLEAHEKKINALTDRTNGLCNMAGDLRHEFEALRAEVLRPSLVPEDEA